MDVFGLEPMQATIVITIIGVLMQVGLGQDIKFEDFGDTLKGLFGSVTSMRFDNQQGYEPANYKITAFQTAAS